MNHIIVLAYEGTAPSDYVMKRLVDELVAVGLTKTQVETTHFDSMDIAKLAATSSMTSQVHEEPSQEQLRNAIILIGTTFYKELQSKDVIGFIINLHNGAKYDQNLANAVHLVASSVNLPSDALVHHNITTKELVQIRRVSKALKD